MNKRNLDIDTTQIKQLLDDLEDIKKTGHIYKPLVIFYENRISDTLGSLRLAVGEAQAYVDEIKNQMR